MLTLDEIHQRYMENKDSITSEEAFYLFSDMLCLDQKDFLEFLGVNND